MRIGGTDSGQAVLAGEQRCLLVGRAADHSRVVGLDPIDQVGDRFERGAGLAPEAAPPVKRMRDADEPALLSNRGDRLDRGEARRHCFPQEERDHVAVGRLDFLADDDGET